MGRKRRMQTSFDDSEFCFVFDSFGCNVRFGCSDYIFEKKEFIFG